MYKKMGRGKIVASVCARESERERERDTHTHTHTIDCENTPKPMSDVCQD